MKVDLSALKDQMASITEAMLKLQKTIEDNATTAASNTAREAEPMLQPAINLGRDRNTTVFGRRYSPQAYPYGLPPDFTPRTAPDGHVVALLEDRGGSARPVLVLDPA